MSEVQRRLMAIMFTDIVGYSALTGRDEMLAMELLQEHHSLLRPIFGRHGGIEVKTIGDAFMVEFPSVVNAVSAAIEMQRTLADRNSTETEPRRLLVRIGVHAGDVIFRDNDVFGEGVNIASRIEPLAPAGGICVSEDVARQIRNKIAFPVVELGRAQLKNIDLPMKVFSIQLPWLAPPPVSVRKASARGAKAKLAPTPRAGQAWWKWGAAAALVLAVAAGALMVVGAGGGSAGLEGMMSSVDGQIADVQADEATVDDEATSVPAEDDASADPAGGAPAAPARPAGPSADDVRQSARAAFDAGIYADAISQYQTLVRLRPKDADAFYHLGRSYGFTDDTERAITNLTQAAALQDDSALYHIHLGLALEKAKRFENAATQFERAIELGGHQEFSEAALTANLEWATARAELSALTPHTATVKHDHLMGSCSGALVLTEESIAYTAEGDDAFNVWLTDVAALGGANDNVSVELRTGRTFNFEMARADAETFRRMYQLASIAQP